MKLKQIALAIAAFASLSGGAQAAIEAQGGNNGTLYVYAFDPASRDFYIRDLGFLMNSFLPGAPLKAADAAPFVDVATDAGLNLNAGNTANFADASFSSWLNNRTGILWAVGAVDNISAGSGAGATNVQRMITSSAAGTLTAPTNTTITNYIGTGRAGGFDGFVPTGISQTFAALANAEFDNNFGVGVNTLATLGSSASLFLLERTVPNLSGNIAANVSTYSNSLYTAAVSLAANGDFSYVLQPANVAAVPLPAAAWLMGAGLVAMGGFVRRRRAAAAAA